MNEQQVFEQKSCSTEIDTDIAITSSHYDIQKKYCPIKLFVITNALYFKLFWVVDNN